MHKAVQQAFTNMNQVKTTSKFRIIAKRRARKLNASNASNASQGVLIQIATSVPFGSTHERSHACLLPLLTVRGTDANNPALRHLAETILLTHDIRDPRLFNNGFNVYTYLETGF